MKEILTKKIDPKEMRAIWFPMDWHSEIIKGAESEGLPIYKYLMMLHNNYQIAQKEKCQKV